MGTKCMSEPGGFTEGTQVITWPNSMLKLALIYIYIFFLLRLVI